MECEEIKTSNIGNYFQTLWGERHKTIAGYGCMYEDRYKYTHIFKYFKLNLF